TREGSYTNNCLWFVEVMMLESWWWQSEFVQVVLCYCVLKDRCQNVLVDYEMNYTQHRLVCYG
ncbi:uncharacterized protein METZ01_LOCUS91456, partial [marine metagenome]